MWALPRSFSDDRRTARPWNRFQALHRLDFKVVNVRCTMASHPIVSAFSSLDISWEHCRDKIRRRLITRSSIASPQARAVEEPYSQTAQNQDSRRHGFCLSVPAVSIMNARVSPPFSRP